MIWAFLAGVVAGIALALLAIAALIAAEVIWGGERL